MSRKKNTVPTYLKHPTQNEARCWAGGQWISLGKFGTVESQAEYERICAEVRAAAERGVPFRPGVRRTVSDVVSEFIRFAVEHYRDARGRPTAELRIYGDATRPLLEMFGDTPAAEFGPLALQAVRQRMIDGDGTEGCKGWCRTLVNKNVSRLRRLFRWAAAQELVPASLPHGLACVQGLQKGRTTARESEPVQPVPSKVVDTLLPKLTPTLRAMIELQRYTGMRPGEVRLLRPCDVDTSGELWVYRLDEHKTAHKGKDRRIVLGPKARAVLAPWLKRTQSEARCFTPANAKEERYAALRSTRVSKVTPSQLNRRKPAEQLEKVAGDEFTDHGYAGMVRRAAERAGLPPFHPHQLRHTFATEVRKTFGLEAAQVILGHSRADVTQIYAERNMSLAAKVASEIG